MNNKYFLMVAPEDCINMEFYIVSDRFMVAPMCKAFQNILSELYQGDLKDIAIKEVIRMACREFNIRFEGYNIKPYVVPIDNIIYF